jgi:hypothetical protein
MFHDRRGLSFPDLKSSFGVKYWKFPFSDLSWEKKIFNSNFPMFHGKRRLSFPDLKSSFAVKHWKFPFSDLSREKKVFKDEIEIIGVQVWNFF